MHTPYLLSLDMGTSSIGYVVFAIDEDGEPTAIEDLGVRIFPDGRDPDSNSNEPLAVARRKARGIRRTRDRGQNRVRRLVKELIECGLLPANDQERKIILQQTCPYEARALAVNQPVEPYTLGRAIFHLGRRRGFKSNRLASGGEESEYKSKIESLRKSLGDQTLGEYLYQKIKQNKVLANKGTPIKQTPVRFRNGETEFYADRAMYQSEFRKIQETQGNTLISDAQWALLAETVFFQYPLKPVLKGKCRFFPEETRAHIDLPISHEFRILQEVNNLKYVSQGVNHDLTERQHNAIIHALNKSKSKTFSSLVKLKDEHKNPFFPSDAQFNLDVASRSSKLIGNETLINLRKTDYLGKLADTLSTDKLNDIIEYLIEPFEQVAGKNVIASDDKVISYLKEQLPSLSDEQINNLSNYRFKRGTASVSRKFMEQINPFLKQGLIYSDAVTQLGNETGIPLHHSHFSMDELMDELPYYGVAMPESVWGEKPESDANKAPHERDEDAYQYGKIANPTVHLALNQLRFVVNQAIAKMGGTPQKIHIELTRDLKNSKQAREELSRNNAKNKKNNDRIKDLLKTEFGIENPRREDIQKVKLWEELDDRTCIFTEQRISARQLFNGEVEIEHIIPFSRCYDDGINNKTLAFKNANNIKGNRTPFEAFGVDQERYSIMMKRALKSFGHSSKYERFKEGAFEKFYGGDRGDMIARQLNDTKYISRKAKQYLSCICEPQSIISVNGQITAILRDVWQLNYYKDKTTDNYRNDHRHHIVDAFVVGMTSRSLIKRINTTTSKDQRHINNLYQFLKDRVSDNLDASLKAQLKHMLGAVNASYKPDHTDQGSMCNGTAYGFTELDGKKYGVTRKPVNKLKHSDIFSIRDSLIKKRILQHLTNNKNTIDQNKLRSTIPKSQLTHKLADFTKTTGIKSVRILVKNQSISPIQSAPYKGYALNSYAYCDIWQTPYKRDKKTGKYTYKYEGAFVPYAEVNQYKSTPKRPVDKEGRSHPAAKKLMRLYKNDCIELVDKRSGEVFSKRVAGYSVSNNKIDLRNNLESQNKERKFISINKIFNENHVSKKKI
ncbi:MAG: type II CRISPR RNA-guided endonuclease Cas9 [Proteobacteria bacterium]|nr:MAG: type II CRISPR RNA-guided endonuclease Cas9 [Pseudomonadota bacterium]